MKRRIFATLLALCMAFSLMSATAWADSTTECNGGEGCTHAAAIGETHYDTLAEAINAVNDGDTVILLKDSAGNGIKVQSGKNFTVDFNKHTYDVNGDLVGSSGTETNCLQLLKDSTITFKNGTLTSSNSTYSSQILIQNYSNLTLDNMTVSAGVPFDYIVSNNNGNVVIKDTTIIAAGGKVAFDVCRYSSYTGPSVTVTGNSVINGNVEISSSGAKDGAIHKLNVAGGTFNGRIYTSGSNPNFVGNITGGTFSFLDCLNYLAEGADVTVKLANNVNTTNTIAISNGAKVTLDLNGQTITANLSGVGGSNSAIDTDNASLEIKDSVGTGKLVSDEYGITASNGGTITMTSGTIESGYAALSGNNTTGDMNFVINGGTLTSTQSEAIYMPGQQELNITGGTLNGGISARMGQINISGGTINGMTAEQSADSFEEYWNYPGSAWIGDAIYVWGGTYKSDNATYGNSCTINITGGTINGNAHNAIAVYDIANNHDQTIKINVSGNAVVNGAIVEDHSKDQNVKDVSTTWTVTGGTYSSNPTAYVDTKHYSVTEADGKFVVSQITNTVTFQSNGGSAVETQTVPFESTATRPADPTRSGFTFGGWYTNGALTTAYDFGASVTKDIILFAKWNSTAVDSGSDSGASSGGSTGGTETKPDDSGTTTVTNPDGSKTETTTNEDGSKTETTTNTTTNKDGSTTETKVETVTNADGSKTETKSETKTDATGAKTSTETVKATDTTGSTGTTTITTNAAGETTVTAEATVTDKAVTEAAKTGAAVTVPVEVPAATTTAAAAEVKISVPASAGSVAVEVPVTNTGVGVVAVIVKEDGTEEIVKTAVPTENGVALNVEGNATVKIVDNSKSFNDVKTTDWHDSAVTFVAAREIMDGVGGNNFAPNTVLSRGMIAKVLHNFENNPATTAENLFNDVDDNTWYTDAVKWAAENKIVEGDGNNYAPNDNITREQLAAILYRYANVKGFDVTKTGDLGTYNDGANTSSWAQTAMEWAVANGILSGKGNNILDPKGAASRAEVAQILMNFCTNVAQ